VLFYGIEALLAAGIQEIGIVVGDTYEEIRSRVGDGPQWGPSVHFTYIHQDAPRGLAHAVSTAQAFVGDDRFLMYLGDNFIGGSLNPLVDGFSAADCPYSAKILLAHVPNPTAFGVAEVEPAAQGPADGPAADFKVRRLVEKPNEPRSTLAVTGVYCFDHHIFEAARAIKPSARGELEITDAIQWLIDQRFDVRARILDDYWIDTGSLDAILEANRQALTDLQPEIDSTAVIAPDTTLQGSVTVQAGAQIMASIVRGPVIIGERATIEAAYVGPYTSISAGVTITSSEIEDSIVLEQSRIVAIPGRIQGSLIGRSSEIAGGGPKPLGHRLLVGDYSRVRIQE
jgi:glucose-1-phosphate thymidylyltransferase